MSSIYGVKFRSNSATWKKIFAPLQASLNKWSFIVICSILQILDYVIIIFVQDRSARFSSIKKLFAVQGKPSQVLTSSHWLLSCLSFALHLSPGICALLLAWSRRHHLHEKSPSRILAAEYKTVALTWLIWRWLQQTQWQSNSYWFATVSLNFQSDNIESEMWNQ